MRVLQLIDSLQAGGAERVAVNYANDLINHTQGSFLCITRQEGILKESIAKNVNYLFLEKRSTLDFKAIKTLNRFIKNNEVSIIHAHGSSYFFGTIMKILNPKIKLIWHEHYGNREKTSLFNKFVLKLSSYYFSTIVTVNEYLKIRSKQKLKTKYVYFLPNYAVDNKVLKSTLLLGEDNKRIVCLANLRPDKDHVNLLKAFNRVIKAHPDWSLHIIGKDFEDEYSKDVHLFIKERKLSNHVFTYGSCLDTSNILSQSNIGVLSSKSEGLPLALLEYGLAKLAVVVTHVGDCKEVIKDNTYGRLVSPNTEIDLANSLIEVIENKMLQKELGNALYNRTVENYGKNQAIGKLINIYQSTLNE